MSRREKLRGRFKSMPKDFSWEELEVLLDGFGYVQEKGGKTGGSRVRFAHDDLPPIILHKPHPSTILKGYQMKQILEFLNEEGLL
jgi:hypothetical protein